LTVHDFYHHQQAQSCGRKQDTDRKLYMVLLSLSQIMLLFC